MKPTPEQIQAAQAELQDYIGDNKGTLESRVALVVDLVLRWVSGDVSYPLNPLDEAKATAESIRNFGIK